MINTGGAVHGKDAGHKGSVLKKYCGQVSLEFCSLENVANWFHGDETHLLSFLSAVNLHSIIPPQHVC